MVEKKVHQTNKRIKRKQADEKSARIKKAKVIKKFFTWTILIAILVGIILFLCKSELFEICNIEIIGNNQVSKETLIQLSEINLKDNIFLSNTIKAKKKIVQNSYIKEVNVKRILPDKIKIEILEKEKAYMIQLDEKVVYMDKNGDILEISDIKLDTLITLQGYLTEKDKIESEKKLNEEDIERLEDIQQIVKSSEKINIQDKITNINIRDKNNYVLTLKEYRKIIYIGDTSNLANKMLYIKAILEKTEDKEGKIFLNGKFNDGFDPYFREEANNL